MKLKFIHDAGHGWLEVPLDKFPDAEKYGTGFGFLDEAGRVIYLEEDIEARLFIGDHPEIAMSIDYEEHDGDSAVRLLPRNKKVAEL